MELQKRFLIIVLYLLYTSALHAQKDSNLTPTPYKVNLKYEAPITIGALGLMQYGYSKITDHAALTPKQALALDKQNVNRFDRTVFEFPTTGYKSARIKSDITLVSSFGLPALLLLDKNIRRDWKEVITIYAQTHMASLGLYLGTTWAIRKPRPLAYNSNYPIEMRTGKSTSNSFFSGHVNTTATSTFFMARVYDDYHHLTLGHKVLLYTAAAIPPALTARYRMRAGKHFRTDVMTGFAVGAATGILIPSLHKKRKNKSLTYVPHYSNRQIGLVIHYKL